MLKMIATIIWLVKIVLFSNDITLRKLCKYNLPILTIYPQSPSLLIVYSLISLNVSNGENYRSFCVLVYAIWFKALSL